MPCLARTTNSHVRMIPAVFMVYDTLVETVHLFYTTDFLGVLLISISWMPFSAQTLDNVDPLFTLVIT